MNSFNGIDVGLHNLWRTSSAKSRSISAENFTGEKGAGAMAVEGTGANASRELGKGWKVSPSIFLPGKETAKLATIEGPGAIQHIWITCHKSHLRSLVLRFFWDDETEPSVEVPYGDFFCHGWGEFAQVSSIPVACNPNCGMNSYWITPFENIKAFLDEAVRYGTEHRTGYSGIKH